MAKNKVIRWFFALAILLSGTVASFYAAKWLQVLLGLPSFTIVRRGNSTDLVVLTLTVLLFIGYLYLVPKLLRVDHDEISRMMRGE